MNSVFQSEFEPMVIKENYLLLNLGVYGRRILYVISLDIFSEETVDVNTMPPRDIF